MSIAYRRHGRTYGAVRLLNPTLDEERAISAFFDRDYFNQALIRISLGDFQRQLEKVFPNMEFSTLLTAYLELADKQEGQNTSKALRLALTDAIIKILFEKYAGTDAFRWLTNIASHTRRTYRPWVLQHQIEPEKTIAMIDTVAAMLNNIPKSAKPIPLTQFGQEFGLPVGSLDYGNSYGDLFLRGLSTVLDTPLPYNTETAAGLFLKAGLLYGATLCQVTVQNIQAITTDNTPCPICNHYNQRGQSFVITLENMQDIKHIKTLNNAAFVIEDPLVYNAIKDRLGHIKATLISPKSITCPGFLYILDNIISSGSKVYYAGNIDYKSLPLADELYLKYGKKFTPWRYSKKDYDLMITQETRILQGEKKDLAMHNDALALILSRIRKTGKTASRKPLIPQMIHDIITLLNNTQPEVAVDEK